MSALPGLLILAGYAATVWHFGPVGLAAVAVHIAILLLGAR